MSPDRDDLRQSGGFMGEPGLRGGARELILGPRIRRQEFLNLARRAGDYHFFDLRGATPQGNDTVLSGNFSVVTLAPGLSVHTASVVDECSQRSENEIGDGIKIVMLLEGFTELSYGHHALQLGPAGGVCSGVLLAVRDRATFTRTWLRGRAEAKLVFSLSRQWLAENLGFDGSDFAKRVCDFADEHLALLEWQPSARARMLARELIAPPLPGEGLRHARQTAHCLDIVIEALERVGRGETGVSVQARRQLIASRLCEILQTPGVGQLSMSEIAREVGSNPASLQQISREALGMTVFEYLRDQALQRAHAALRQGMAVSAAASLAGYASQSNFATAFRRRFGVTPRSVRGR